MGNPKIVCKDLYSFSNPINLTWPFPDQSLQDTSWWQAGGWRHKQMSATLVTPFGAQPLGCQNLPRMAGDRKWSTPQGWIEFRIYSSQPSIDQSMLNPRVDLLNSNNYTKSKIDIIYISLYISGSLFFQVFPRLSWKATCLVLFSLIWSCDVLWQCTKSRCMNAVVFWTKWMRRTHSSIQIQLGSQMFRFNLALQQLWASLSSQCRTPL